MQAELRRKVSDRIFREIGKLAREPFVGTTRGSIQPLHGDFVLAQKIGIASSRLETYGLDLVQELDRIMLCVFPEVRIDPLKQKAGAIIPTPFQVISKLFQASDPLRNLRKPSCQHQVLWTRRVISGQAALETLDEIVHFLVGQMPYVTDPERCVFHLSQAAGNLYPEIVFQ